ncbi:iron(III) transport system ATP-binding protein [Scopulibacillus daqui]|uniref:Iron(III) transport system ATP-binding protein n=1 Tax=Scopulibacillus daqui TaxID=1469162 RepID=A0ABS2Q1F4_9BACL|nr:ABC transporter ATP-binding protein [Scopulibacillus daqui]MBM7646124.1 iron(III) transport system ATP-binding protein [Scopulibacillus daqui]
MKDLRITSLNKSFGKVNVLRDVNLHVPSGQIAAVLGPSGCGKTTLLRTIAGFEEPEIGQIKVGDTVVCNSSRTLPPEKRKIGYVPQEGALFPHLTVAGNVAFGLPRKLRRSGRVEEMLELTGMANLGDRMPHELSGGQQQRVALARALAPSPSLILLDEPFSALDAGLRAALREDVRQALKELGTTAIIVTHDQEEALSMADIVSVMKDGQIIQTADPMTLYKSPVDLETANFVGETIQLTANIKNACANCIFGQLPIQSCCQASSNQATVMIRPEQFIIQHPEEGIRAQVTAVKYLGHDALLTLRIIDHPQGEFEVSARVSGLSNYNIGDIVGLKVDGEVMAYPFKNKQDQISMPV